MTRFDFNNLLLKDNHHFFNIDACKERKGHEPNLQNNHRPGDDFGSPSFLACRSGILFVVSISPVPRKMVTGISPKVWISKDGDTLFWTGEWDDDRGLWVVNVGSAISSEPGTFAYAITMANADGCQYIAGQGVFSVYSNIASGSGTSGDDEPGTSIMELVAALTMRVEALEANT